MTKAAGKREEGLVAIIVTMVMLLVISLIVVTFARIIRREQRQALDRQLNTQAFYAAESGVNAVVNELRAKTNPALVTYLSTKSTCDKDPYGFQDGINTIDGSGNVAITCLTMTGAPTSQVFDSVDNNSQVVTMRSSNGTLINAITLKWEDPLASGTNTCPVTALNLPAASAWTCPVGILRFDLVQSEDTQLSRATLLGTFYNAFLYPLSIGGGTTTAYAAGTTVSSQSVRGAFVGTTCTATAPVTCTMTINGLPPRLSYSMRLQSIYKTSKVTVTALNGSTPVATEGGQSIIDVTAKAGDVLRRIQVRVSSESENSIQFPASALSGSDGICKLYEVTSTDVTPSSSDPVCALQ